MSRFFDDLERDLVRAAAARARPARRPFAAFALTAALVLGIAGTAAAGTYLALRGSSIAPFAAADLTPEQRVAPGTSVVTELRADDPDAGVPPWTLRVSHSDTGLQCSTVGQVQDGTFGLVGLDGAFRALPEANADACGEPGTLLGTRIFAAERARDARTVVNGVAGPDLRQVTISIAGGKPEVVPHTEDGAFLFVARRYPEDTQPVVTLRRAGGAERRYAFAAGRTTVRDPYGGGAWSLTTMIVGTSTERPVPTVQTACVTFHAARAVPGEPGVSSPSVCGEVRVRAKRALYFDTRRLRGNGAGWNGHPARVAVWGSAWGHDRIVVRAPGFEQDVSPKPNGAFLVLPPPSTDPAEVTVEVDGERHGASFGTVPPPRGNG